MSRSIQPFSHRVREQRITSGKVWVLSRTCLPPMERTPIPSVYNFIRENVRLASTFLAFQRIFRDVNYPSLSNKRWSATEYIIRLKLDFHQSFGRKRRKKKKIKQWKSFEEQFDFSFTVATIRFADRSDFTQFRCENSFPPTFIVDLSRVCPVIFRIEVNEKMIKETKEDKTYGRRGEKRIETRRYVPKLLIYRCVWYPSSVNESSEAAGWKWLNEYTCVYPRRAHTRLMSRCEIVF